MNVIGRASVCAVMCAGAVMLGMMVRQQAQPTVVATVDLQRVFKALNIASEAVERVQQLASSLEAERQAKEDAVRKLQEELDFWPPQSPEYAEAQKKTMTAVADYQAFNVHAQWKLDMKSGEAFRTTYEEIKKDIAAFANSNGYELVLLDDSVRAIDPAGEENTIAQISAQKVLYAGTTVDITEPLIAWMNQQ